MVSYTRKAKQNSFQNHLCQWSDSQIVKLRLADSPQGFHSQSISLILTGVMGMWLQTPQTKTPGFSQQVGAYKEQPPSKLVLSSS